MYPESEEEEDKTSITSQNEISSLVNQMTPPTDKERALAALAAELGAEGDDGTVEIQNPMELWKNAQDALQQSAPAPAEEEEDDFAATEVLDPGSLNFANFGNQQPAAPPQPAQPPIQQGSPQQQAYQPPQQPAYQQPAQQPAYQQPAHQQPAQPPMQPSGFASQYAPDTPPAGRQTSGEWAQANAPQAQANAPGQVPVPQGAPTPGFGAPAADHGFQRSPSGLSSAALFEDSEANAAAPPQQQSFAPEPAGAPEAAAPAAAADHPGPWKLKTNFGLTYEFPDTRGLRSWLSSREELDGYTVSADDGGSFHPLSAFPQLDRGAARRMSSPGGGSGMQPASSGLYQNPVPGGQPGQQPAPGGAANPYGSGLNPAGPPPNFGGAPAQQEPIRGPKVTNEYRPPSRESKSKGLLWLVFFLLAAVAVVVALETFGIFKVSELISGPKVEHAHTPADPAKNDQKGNDAPTVDPDELAKKQAAEVERFLKDVERKIEGNKLPAALDVLATAEQIAPDDVRIHQLKAQVHDKLGQPEKADASRKRVEELNAAAQPDEAPQDEPAPEDDTE